MRPARLLLFDLDGTLIDSRADITAAANAALAPLGVGPFRLEDVMPHVGRGAASLLAALLERDIRTLEVQDSVSRFISYYAQHLNVHTRLYPGVMQMLEHFQALPMVVVSNKPALLARGVLEQIGISGLFRGVYGGDSFARKKPDPLPILEVIASFPGPMEQVIMVGDSGVDIEAGQRAGVLTCGVLYGLGTREELAGAGADLLIEDASDLMREFQIPDETC